MTTANGITGSNGERSYFMNTSGRFISNHKFHEKRQDIFDVEISMELRAVPLRELLSNKKFSLLARYLDDKGTHLESMCSYGSEGVVREVQCGVTRYRSNTFKIYTRGVDV